MSSVRRNLYSMVFIIFNFNVNKLNGSILRIMSYWMFFVLLMLEFFSMIIENDD